MLCGLGPLNFNPIHSEGLSYYFETTDKYGNIRFAF